MELTREMIEDALRCESIVNCHDCKMKNGGIDACVMNMAKQLLAERAKPKVWDGAPDGCNRIDLLFKHEVPGCTGTIGSATYTRELPKSSIDLIAEKACIKFAEHG